MDKVLNYGNTFITDRGTDSFDAEPGKGLVSWLLTRVTAVINPITSDPCFIGSN
jgi:hypothetical protein